MQKAEKEQLSQEQEQEQEQEQKADPPIPKIIPLWKDFTYFAHQLDGIKWMLEKEIHGTVVPTRNYSSTLTIRGGFQCDDMGLGKTIQIASVIFNHPLQSTLILAPLAMIDTWSSVCKRMGVRVYEVDGDWKCMNDPAGAIPKRFIKTRRPSVYITNFEKVYFNPSLFRKEWDRVVLDEAHKIRNGDSRVAVAARKLVAPIRWAVTGTPLVNSYKDIVSLMAFIGVPYSPLWKWEPRYLEILPNVVIHRSLNSLRNVIEGAPPVPKIHEVILPFTTKEEEEFYYGVQGTREELLSKYAKEQLNNAAMFTLLLRLRQISVHPQVYINAKRREATKQGISYERENWNHLCTKFEEIRRIIKNDKKDPEVHKYIIFCQFNEEMDILGSFLINEGLTTNVLMYNGSMNQKERTAVLKESKESTENTVLLLQLQAGGVGLNLQEYDRVVFMSPWWTSALMDQAIARAVRMGQTKVVHVYHLKLQAENESSINIDSLINDAADQKRIMLENLFAICEGVQEPVQEQK